MQAVSGTEAKSTATAQTTEEFNDIRECVDSFHRVTGLGALLCAPEGNVLFAVGKNCRACGLCKCLDLPEDLCVVSRAQAWRDAERFGGKYIYACPVGLTCIATPVQTELDRIANITVGPFLMVDEEDFVQCELKSRAKDAKRLAQAGQELRTIPWVSPEQAEPIARQLFLSVGGIGKSFSIGDLLTRQSTDRLMGNLSDFAENEKLADDPASEYPILMEHDFLEAIAASDRSKAETLLNDLLGHIFFLTGGDFPKIRARILELLVLSSRAAIDAGADETQILSLCERCVGQMGDIYDVDKLCYWLTAVLKRFFDCLFDREIVDGQNPMPRVLAYMRRNCTQRITLEDAADKAHLSPSYFSRLFRARTGRTFTDYLTRLRIDHAKRLLGQTELDMAQIAAQSGFYDQSHFTRAFKGVTGLTPGAYRRRRERGFDELKDT